MRVLIATVKVPFIHGGAEILADSLLQALRAEGHTADIVAIPYKHYPPERILDHMLACRLLDLTGAFGNSIDRLIGLKFPAYLIPHPNKVLWILHQHRQAYDLWAHPQAGDLLHAPNGHVIRDAIHQADRNLIPEAKTIFTLSANVSRRLKQGCGIDSSPLYNPPANAASFYCSEPLDYLFHPSRINFLKRQTLILQALGHTRHPVRVVFAGAADSPQQFQDCETLVGQLGLNGRVQFLGHVSETKKLQLYAESLGVIFPPHDEDYGYIMLEAMLSCKPVITCTDSGGPLEFLIHRQTGLAVEPSAEALAESLDEIWADRSRARQWGLAGRKRYEDLHISWENVVSQLLA
jgi:glycosyltransferase involved in cell wall biosynthesis